MKQEKLGARLWSALLVFGLFGQLAWMMENMYLNVFVYQTISDDPGIIANMVAASALTATLTTLLVGALTDKVGKRKVFIVAGYVLWGLSTMAFGVISVQNAAALFPGVNAVHLAATLVILMDCVMTFFGSSANDAAFNAWVTDITVEKNRGRVESVLAILPLVAMLVIFGGLDGLIQQGKWPLFFTIIGALVTLGGLAGLFLIKDPPALSSSRTGYFSNIVHGLRPSVIKRHPSLYTTFTALAVLGASTQTFMPYLIIYIQKTLGIQDYALLLGAVLICASAVSVLGGRWIDRMGKLKFVYPALLAELIGLALMFMARQPWLVAIAGTILLGGNMLLGAVINALVRDYTPADKAGHFQGIRMLFAVLIPMVTGPYIGAAVIRGSNQIYVDLGVVKQVPTAGIFMASAAVLLLVLIPMMMLKRKAAAPVPRYHALLTPWGEKMDPAHVLQEYPRPQMVRDSYLNLNGMWEYAITDTDAMPEGFDGQILVPFSPESILSGVNRQLQPGQTLWYRRSISIPEGFVAGRLLLHFGAVDQSCRVLFNGHEVGGHEGGYLPFVLDVTPYLQEGGQVLVVKARDSSNQSLRHAYGKQSLSRGGIWYTAQSGIWQTVWMESVPQAYIRGLAITPLFDEAAVCIKLDLVGEAAKTVMTIKDGERVVATATPDPNGKARIAMPNFKPWTPQSPFLYTLIVQHGQDCVSSYFGMRKFAAAKDSQGNVRLTLNNQPYYHHGVLDQGYWSDGLYTPPSDEAMIHDIVTMKQAGFNMLRKHIKIEPMRWYYHCDRLGMLVWQDMVSGGEAYKPWIIQVLPFIGIGLKDGRYGLFGRADQQGREQFLQDMADTVHQLYNCVSLCVWVPFNEGWGQFDALDTERKLRKLDQTRTIDHASGWYDQGGGEMKSRHVYYRKVRIRPDGRRVLALTEFGGYSLGIEGHQFSDAVFGYRVYQTPEQFAKGYRDLIRNEIMPAIPKGLSATVYTQASDVEDELNGLMTYDRKQMKVPAEVLREIHRDITL